MLETKQKKKNIHGGVWRRNWGVSQLEQWSYAVVFLWSGGTAMYTSVGPTELVFAIHLNRLLLGWTLPFNILWARRRHLMSQTSLMLGRWVPMTTCCRVRLTSVVKWIMPICNFYSDNAFHCPSVVCSRKNSSFWAFLTRVEMCVAHDPRSSQ